MAGASQSDGEEGVKRIKEDSELIALRQEVAGVMGRLMRSQQWLVLIRMMVKGKKRIKKRILN